MTEKARAAAAIARADSLNEDVIKLLQESLWQRLFFRRWELQLPRKRFGFLASAPEESPSLLKSFASAGRARRSQMANGLSNARLRRSGWQSRARGPAREARWRRPYTECTSIHRNPQSQRQNSVDSFARRDYLYARLSRIASRTLRLS